MRLLRALFQVQIAIVGWLVDEAVARSFCCGRTGWWSLLKFSIAVVAVSALVTLTGEAATALVFWPVTFFLAGILPFGGSPHLPLAWRTTDEGIDNWLTATPFRRKWIASENLKWRYLQTSTDPDDQLELAKAQQALAEHALAVQQEADKRIESASESRVDDSPRQAISNIVKGLLIVGGAVSVSLIIDLATSPLGLLIFIGAIAIGLVMVVIGLLGWAQLRARTKGQRPTSVPPGS